MSMFKLCFSISPMLSSPGDVALSSRSIVVVLVSDGSTVAPGRLRRPGAGVAVPAEEYISYTKSKCYTKRSSECITKW